MLPRFSSKNSRTSFERKQIELQMFTNQSGIASISEFFSSCFPHEAEVRSKRKAFPKFPSNILEKKSFPLDYAKHCTGLGKIIKEIFIVIMRAGLFLRLEALLVKVFLFMVEAIVEICIKTRLHKLFAKARRQMKNLRWNNGESSRNVKIMQ